MLEMGDLSMRDIDIQTIKLGGLQTNCYIVTNVHTKAALIVDPASDVSIIDGIVTKNGLTPVAVLLTHGHFDHTGAAVDVKGAYGIPIVACADEKRLLANSDINGSQLMMGYKIVLSADRWVGDGEELSIGGMDFSMISTPGHTAGSVCFYFKSDGALISGDTLFHGSFGRYDFPTGSLAQLVHSICGVLFALPDATAVYPGHGANTTIGYEKKHNMILHMDPKDI